MDIVKYQVADIKPANYNPRKSLKAGDAEYEKIKNSLEHFGYIEPIIINKRTGNIVGGHQRFTVIKDLGYTTVDVVEVDLDDKKEKALNVALNKIKGSWDNNKLAKLISDMSQDNIELTGFNEIEVTSLLASFSMPETFHFEAPALDDVEDKYSDIGDNDNNKSKSYEEDDEDCEYDEDDQGESSGNFGHSDDVTYSENSDGACEDCSGEEYEDNEDIGEDDNITEDDNIVDDDDVPEDMVMVKGDMVTNYIITITVDRSRINEIKDIFAEAGVTLNSSGQTTVVDGDKFEV